MSLKAKKRNRKKEQHRAVVKKWEELKEMKFLKRFEILANFLHLLFY